MDDQRASAATYSLGPYGIGLNTQKIEQFVAEACEGRPPSHGLEHMQKVRDNALEIRKHLPGHLQPSAFDVSLVALLHDVADHKYDKDGLLMGRIRDFLVLHNFDPFPIIQCIDAISFSKEKRAGKRWFKRVMDPYWVNVRDVVSDADKLEALGRIGGMRCLQYAEEQGHVGRDGILHLLQHMKEKLLLLRDEYIVTAPGREMAVPLHEELVDFALQETIAHLSMR